MTETVSSSWLDQIVEQISQHQPKGELVVSSGHSPSGVYHIGTLREIMTAHAITWALRRAGRRARHVDFVDDFDAFRKVPAGVPEEWSRYIGQPLAVVLDPFECHPSYGAHYLAELHEGLKALDVVPDETISGYQNYRDGIFVDQIVAALDNLPQVRRILTEVGGRQLDEQWAPVQILDDNQNLRTLKFAGWDTQKRMVTWRDKGGRTGQVGIDNGRVKLDWRLDWPARWVKWRVSVEPFGRDHATKGGSYDTGKALVEEIFGGEAPYPVPYEFINSLGQTKKMSKSSGGVLTPAGALEVMPPEILRYFVIRSRPSRTLIFDAGLGLYTLIDDFTKDQAAVDAATEYAHAGRNEDTISSVPFNHLVSVYQTARQDADQVRQILGRSGYERAVAEQWPVIQRELKFVHNWLAKYAPESVRFSVQEELPQVELAENQKVFLAKLADTIEVEDDLSGQGMHDAVYAASQVAGIKAGEAFKALYKVLLGKDFGPKAGWFLASLDQKWLINRLREASEMEQAETGVTSALSAQLPDERKFIVDEAIFRAFPEAAIGYVVANVKVRNEGIHQLEELKKNLEERRVERDNLLQQPEIAVWRAAYKTFGVKPSEFRCSVEALTRRVLDDKPVRVNSIVDTYNYVSVKHLLPMGAMDLEHVSGDIRLRFGKTGETAHLLGVEKPVEVTDEQIIYADDDKVITWLWNYRDARETAVSLTTTQAIFFIDSLQGRGPVEAALADLTQELEAVTTHVIARGILTLS